MTRILVLALAVVLTASAALGASSKAHKTEIAGWTYIQSPQNPGLYEGGSATFKLVGGGHKFTITSERDGFFELNPGVPNGTYV